jgi:hypothetical protein
MIKRIGLTVILIGALLFAFMCIYAETPLKQDIWLMTITITSIITIFSGIIIILTRR